MNVFFDNCTSPVMARTLAGYLGGEHNVEHARGMNVDRLSDIEWIERLRSLGGAWYVVTGDGRIGKNKAEREAFRRAGLGGFFLAPAYQKTPMGRCCGLLVARWDELVAYADKTQRPFLIGVPINLGSKFRPSPL